MRRRFSGRETLAAIVALLLTLTAQTAIGDSSPIPAGVQMRLFSKIWMFDRSLAGNDEIVMAILYQSTFRTSAETKDRLIDAVRGGGFKIRCIPVPLDDLDGVSTALQSVNADVFYVTEMRGINISDIVGVSRARRIKTITVVSAYVQGGVAISLRVRNDKADIVVNLSAAKTEGSDLTAQLLRVATLIGEPAPQ
ncbi:MAG: hypothetical protein QOK37_4115 [Thermoanaerobaculia bacterium]|jgi:hypothetical protein|nr:hypothetical protein [Thermoanaerobaculia bacterium]